MIEVADVRTGNILNLQWVMTATFLGVLFCIVLGIFKRFKASFSIRSDNEERGAVQPRMGVYRNFEYKTYIPVYTQINEVEASSTLPVQTSIGYPQKNEQMTSRPTNNNIASGSSIPKVNETFDQRIKGSRKPVAPEIPKTPTLPDIQSKKKNSTKGAAPLKPTEDKVKHIDDKKKLEKLRKEEEKLKKEQAAKLKKEKELKEKRIKEEAVKKEREEKAEQGKEVKVKKEKGKSENNQSKKSMAPTKPLSDNPIVSQNLPPYSLLDSKNNILGSKNPTGSLQDLSPNPVVVNNTFASSWDLVAEHRQNMQREIRTPTPGRNLRSIASRGVSNSREFDTPSKKSPSKGLNISQRYSGGDSDMSNTDA